MSQDGRVEAEPVRPVCMLEAPVLTNLDAKRKLIQKIESAIGEAYAGIANTDEVLVLINTYSLDDVGTGARLQSDKPEVVAAVRGSTTNRATRATSAWAHQEVLWGTRSMRLTRHGCSDRGGYAERLSGRGRGPAVETGAGNGGPAPQYLAFCR